MPPVDEISGLAEGLGDAFGNFSRALASVMQHQEARARSSRQRERENLMDRIELAATPGVSVGSPEELPMHPGPASEASSGGPFTEALMGGARGFDPEASSGRVSVAPGGESPGGTFSGELARQIAGTDRPEVESSTAQRMGELGGTPVFFDRRAARRATMEEPDPNLPPWREEGFDSREEYLAFLREKERATAGPEAGAGATSDQTFDPTSDQLAQVGVPAPIISALEGAPVEDRAETFRRYATGVEDPLQGGGGGPRGDRPSFPEARALLRDQLYAPNEAGEMTPVAPLTPGRELNIASIMTRNPEAAQDSIAKIFQEATTPPDTAASPDQQVAEGGENDVPLVPEWAENLGGEVGRFTGGLVRSMTGADDPGGRETTAPADTTPTDTASGPETIYGAPRERVEQAIQSAGSIDAAISRLEGFGTLRPNEEAVLEALRQLQSSGFPRGR